MSKRTTGTVSAVAAMALLLSGCGGGSGEGAPEGEGDFDTQGCLGVFAAVSSEKVGMFQELSNLFAESGASKNLALTEDDCVRIVPIDVASGEAAQLLKQEDPWSSETKKPRPVIWSPASTSWIDDVNDSRSNTKLLPEAESFATSPVVIAMLETMAKTMGWPDKEIGIQDFHDLCVHPEGWGKFDGAVHDTWGGFDLAKTSPETSTTGRNMLLMQAYAASNKTDKLTEADVEKSTQFSKELDSCVIRYGDTTGSVLQDMYNKGASFHNAPVVAVEETSVVNFNMGNPKSAVIKDGQTLERPTEKLVAVYPKGGSLVSDNPIAVLGSDASWITPDQRAAAEAFADFVMTKNAQEVLDDYGFRPVDDSIAVGGAITAENGVNPDLPKVRLEQPSVAVTAAAMRVWNEIRKPSSAALLIDISNSMYEDAGNATRMQRAIDGSKQTLDHFRPTDELGVSVFTTFDEGKVLKEIRPVKPLRGETETLRSEFDGLSPIAGTPLYDAIAQMHDKMTERAEPGRINAIVVISDGEDVDSNMSLDDLKRQLRGSEEIDNPAQVRVFPIVFGNADNYALQQIAEASGGQVFDASDPERLDDALASAMRNF